MRTAADVLSTHEVRGENSCVSWALEFIAKVHEKIPEGEYPIQTTYPKGELAFKPEAIQYLSDLGIKAWEESFELAEFEKISREDADRGYPLVFSVPTSISINIWVPSYSGTNYHGCVATRLNGAEYVTRAHQQQGVLFVQIEALYNLIRSTHIPDWKIHCLRHAPLDASAP